MATKPKKKKAKRPAYMPLSEENAKEVVRLGGYKGRVDFSSRAIRNAISAAYNKGWDDGMFAAQAEQDFPASKQKR